MSSNERRHFHRVNFDADTQLRQGDHAWSAVLIDVSLNGLLVEEPFGWHIDPEQTLNVSIRLGEQTSIHMQCQYRHQHDGLIGFECLEIDIDSISHLRRLVELNLGDAALVERELSALGHPH
jgi:hypothetical protein